MAAKRKRDTHPGSGPRAVGKATKKASGSVGKGGSSVFSQKLGPLPVWSWLAIGGGALYFFTRGSGASPATPAAVTNPAVTRWAQGPTRTKIVKVPEKVKTKGK